MTRPGRPYTSIKGTNRRSRSVRASASANDSGNRLPGTEVNASDIASWPRLTRITGERDGPHAGQAAEDRPQDCIVAGTDRLGGQDQAGQADDQSPPATPGRISRSSRPSPIATETVGSRRSKGRYRPAGERRPPRPGLDPGSGTSGAGRADSSIATRPTVVCGSPPRFHHRPGDPEDRVDDFEKVGFDHRVVPPHVPGTERRARIG